MSTRIIDLMYADETMRNRVGMLDRPSPLRLVEGSSRA
jgi:hypothetical protein